MDTTATNQIGENMAKFEAEIEILTPEEADIEVTESMAERARLARQDMRDAAQAERDAQERQAG